MLTVRAARIIIRRLGSSMQLHPVVVVAHQDAAPDYCHVLDVVTADQRERVAQVIGKVTVPREVRVWHLAIDRLLKEDETRREKQRASPYPMSLSKPLSDYLLNAVGCAS